MLVSEIFIWQIKFQCHHVRQLQKEVLLSTFYLEKTIRTCFIRLGSLQYVFYQPTLYEYSIFHLPSIGISQSLYTSQVELYQFLILNFEGICKFLLTMENAKKCNSKKKTFISDLTSGSLNYSFYKLSDWEHTSIVQPEQIKYFFVIPFYLLKI